MKKIILSGFLILIILFVSGQQGCQPQNNVYNNPQENVIKDIEKTSQPKMMQGYAESIAKNYVYEQGYLNCCRGGCRTRPYEIKVTGSYFDGKSWIVSIDLLVGLDSKYNEYGDPTALTDSRNSFLITVDENENMKSNKQLTC